jgi:hypothetical protein
MKKQTLYPEAERLFVSEHETFESISEKLDVSRRTLSYWAEEGKWAERRAALRVSAQTSHEKTYALFNKLLEKASSDVEGGKDPSPATLYTLTKLAPLLTRVKSYEDTLTTTDESEKPKGLSDDIVKMIEENVLGLKSEVSQ